MSQYTIAVTGHLTNDPYVTRFDNDKINTRLRIASSRRLRTVKPNGDPEWRDTDTVYINIELWGQLAVNTSKSLKRGMPVIALGSLCTDTWTDNETQKQRERTYIRGLQVGIDMNRYILASQRMDGTHNPEGIELNTGSEPLKVDKDYLSDTREVIDDTGMKPQDMSPDEVAIESGAEVDLEDAEDSMPEVVGF